MFISLERFIFRDGTCRKTARCRVLAEEHARNRGLSSVRNVVAKHLKVSAVGLKKEKKYLNVSTML